MKLICQLFFLVAVGISGLTSASEPVSLGLLNSTLWMQNSAEYALSASNVFKRAQARLNIVKNSKTSAALEQAGDKNISRLPPAIIFDLDETLLDNSPFQAYLIQNQQKFTDPLWDQWIQLKQATAIPGAIKFTHAAKNAGFKLFYVSNRSCVTPDNCPNKNATMKNMRTLGFPDAEDSSAFLFKNEKTDWLKDKSSRRQKIAQTHRIVMLVGDDMQDFMSIEKATALRNGDTVIKTLAEQKMGMQWFLLPNAMYGSWIDSLQKQNPDLTAFLKAAPLSNNPTESDTPASKKLSLATWNLEWLMTPSTYHALKPNCDKTGQPASNERRFPCTPGRPAIVDRQPRDFDALAAVVNKLQADVVALQEVDGPEAGVMVFKNGWKLDCFVSRQHPQKVGFAIRSGIPYRCNPELTELDFDGKSRAGADITLYPDTPKAVRLLSVHMKSGCFTGSLASNNSACKALRAQVPVLERWMDTRVREGVAFAIMGDFNRRLEIDSGFNAGSDEEAPTSMFAALNDGVPQGATLKRASEGQPEVKCFPKDRNPASPIDNILLSSQLLPQGQPLQFTRFTYTNEEFADFALSDHCPMQVELSR